MPHFDELEVHYPGESERKRGHERLKRDDQPAAVNPVSENATEWAYYQSWKRIDPANSDHKQRGGLSITREMLHEPAEGEQL